MGCLGAFVCGGFFFVKILSSSFLRPCQNLALTNSFVILGRLRLFKYGFYF